MGHAAGQLTDGLELLRLEQGLARLFQGPLGFQPLGNVAGDLGEADDLAVVAADRVDHHMRPESRPVLALPPALLFEAAFGGGDLERLGRLARLAILFGVEPREVLADDLVGPVALDPLGAGVPAGDHPGRVQQVDRVVGDALDQQAELLLAAAQALLGGPTFGQVAGHLGEADDLALRGADRIYQHMGPEALAVLADPPARGLETAFRFRGLQRACGDAGGAVFRGVELREVLADDLGRLVALEALGPGVPAGHPAGRIQHVDRVVGDRVDQNPVAAFVAPVGVGAVSHRFPRAQGARHPRAQQLAGAKVPARSFLLRASGVAFGSPRGAALSG